MADSSAPLGPGYIGLPITDPARRELLRRGQLSFRVPSQANLSLIEGSATLTILSGDRDTNLGVTHNAGWKTTGRVWVTIQNIDALLGSERPVSAHVYSVGPNAFNISLSAFVVVAANRTVTVAWLASGVLP